LTPRLLYVDEDPHKDLAPHLTDVGHAAVSTNERGHMGRSDPWQLAVAARERRVFITCNFDDFRLLHEAWTSWSTEWGIESRVRHAGILVIPNGNEMMLGQMVDIVVEILEQESTLDNRLFRWRRSIEWLEVFPVTQWASPDPSA
jgi:hypothetical protein